MADARRLGLIEPLQEYRAQRWRQGQRDDRRYRDRGDQGDREFAEEHADDAARE